MKALHRAFKDAETAILTLEALSRAGIRKGEIRRAVSRGDLRQGVTGFWLPERPDPGAMLVMQSALSDSE